MTPNMTLPAVLTKPVLPEDDPGGHMAVLYNNPGDVDRLQDRGRPIPLRHVDRRTGDVGFAQQANAITSFSNVTDAVVLGSVTDSSTRDRRA